VQSLVAMRRAFVGWQARLSDDIITPAELIVAVVEEMKLLETRAAEGRGKRRRESGEGGDEEEGRGRGVGEEVKGRTKKEERDEVTVKKLIEEARKGVWDDKRSKTSAQKLQDFLECILSFARKKARKNP
jgi:hypothetical protein